MQNTDLLFRFPPHLSTTTKRSISLIFILEELIKDHLNYDHLNYYCDFLTIKDDLQNEICKLKIINLQGLEESIAPFFSTLIPYIYQARTDENVLIKLLELRNDLNQKLGANTIDDLLLNLSPLGLTYVKTIISEGLNRRGFTSFLAEKEHLFDRLELCTLAIK